MAWASKKQFAILMSSEEGKNLAEKIGEMEQEEFNKAFSELLGKGGKTGSKPTTEKDENARLKKVAEHRYKNNAHISEMEDTDFIKDTGYFGYGNIDELEKATFGENYNFDDDETDEITFDDDEILDTVEDYLPNYVGSELEDSGFSKEEIETAFEETFNHLVNFWDLKEGNKDYLDLQTKINRLKQEVIQHYHP